MPFVVRPSFSLQERQPFPYAPFSSSFLPLVRNGPSSRKLFSFFFSSVKQPITFPCHTARCLQFIHQALPLAVHHSFVFSHCHLSGSFVQFFVPPFPSSFNRLTQFSFQLEFRECSPLRPSLPLTNSISYSIVRSSASAKVNFPSPSP